MKNLTENDLLWEGVWFFEFLQEDCLIVLRTANTRLHLSVHSLTNGGGPTGSSRVHVLSTMMKLITMITFDVPVPGSQQHQDYHYLISPN